MGCCFSSPSEDAERRPLLVHQNQPESARPHPAMTEYPDFMKYLVCLDQSDGSRVVFADTSQKTGSFSARHVGIPDLDLRFKDVAETFNQQQEQYKHMKETLQSISGRYQLSTNGSLSECLKKIKEEHDQSYASLEVKGYDFTLVVRSETETPDKLKQTQKDMTELSRAVKGVVSVGTKLQEMIDSLLKAEETITKQVKDAASSYQEQTRLVDNVKENLKEVKRAKELSPKCRNEAGDLLKEVAELSGITL